MSPLIRFQKKSKHNTYRAFQYTDFSVRIFKQITAASMWTLSSYCDIQQLQVPKEGQEWYVFHISVNRLKFSMSFCNIRIFRINSVGIYLIKVNNRYTRTRCEICSKLTIKTPERCQQHRSGVFIVNFEHISHFVLVFLLLTFSRQMPTGNNLLTFKSRLLRFIYFQACE